MSHCLQVGLAVDDIKEVQHRAGLERSVMKIELIFQVGSTCFPWIILSMFCRLIILVVNFANI